MTSRVGDFTLSSQLFLRTAAGDPLFLCSTGLGDVPGRVPECKRLSVFDFALGMMHHQVGL